MKFEIYSRSNCVFCERAKNLFIKQNLPYNEILVTSDKMKQDLIERVGLPVKSLPQIFVNRYDGLWEYIGGYTELTRFIKEKNDNK